VAKRKAAGLPSVSALFLQKCGELTDHVEAAEIVTKAVTRATKKAKGTAFLLRNLFKDAEWDSFSKTARLSASRTFKAKVDTATIGVIAAEKASANHQIYKRV
jgi:hypothetical protein